MHDIVRYQNPKGLEQLLKILINFVFGEVPVLFNFLIKGSSVAVLVKEVEVVYGLEYFDKADDVRRVYFREDFDLVEGALLELRIFFEPSGVDYFDRYFLAVP